MNLALGPCPDTVSRTVWAGKLQATDGKQITTTWEDLAQEYLADGATVKPKAKLRAPVFCTVRDECTPETCNNCEAGQHKKRHRCDKATTAVTALVFEYDGKELDWPGIAALLSECYGLASLAYDSPSSTADAHKWRLVLPITAHWLETSKWSQAYKALQALFESLLSIDFDKTTSNPSRVFYPPTRPTADTPPRRVVWTPGKALDLRITLASIPKPEQTPTAPRSEPRTPRNGSQGIRRASAYLARMEPSIEGARGSIALIRAAQAMVRGFELSEHDALKLLEQEFNPRCKPPWSKRELEHKVKSSLKGGVMPFGALLEAQNDDWKATTEQEPDGFNVYEKPKEKPPTAPTIKPISDYGFHLADEPPKRDWLLRDKQGKGVFPYGKGGLLVAGGGVGKTMALVQLAVAVAMGTDWLGTFTAKQGKVLLALAEEDIEEVRRRLYNACSLLGLDRDNRTELASQIYPLPLAGIPCALLNEKDEPTAMLTTIKAAVQEHQFALVILDPLSRWAGTEVEIDNGKATRFVQAVESISEGLETKPSVIVAHHSSKSSVGAGEANARGSSAIVDGFRWVANLDDATDLPLRGARLTNTKSNYSPKFEPVYLVRDDEHKGALRQATAHEASTLKKAPAKARALAKKLSKEAEKEVTRELAAMGCDEHGEKLSSSKSPELPKGSETELRTTVTPRF